MIYKIGDHVLRAGDRVVWRGDDTCLHPGQEYLVLEHYECGLGVDCDGNKGQFTHSLDMERMTDWELAKPLTPFEQSVAAYILAELGSGGG